jgi:predicted SAM-dependent methyltransferase
MNKKYLDLGCGSYKFAQHTAEQEFKTKRKNIIRCDLYSTDQIDKKHDISKFPYPFKKNEFDGILLSHVFEHFQNYDGIKLIEELYRITKPSGKIVIYCPHFSSPVAKSHLTHQRLVGYGTLDNFLPSSLEKYSSCDFNFLEKTISYGTFWKKFKIFDYMINKYPALEHYLTVFIPAREIKFVLQPVKDKK